MLSPAFALYTGRLTPWIGTSLMSTVAAAAVVMLLAIPLLTALPRVAMAVGPTVLLYSGLAASAIQQAHLPLWLAWVLASVLSLVLSARLYVFSVVPALAICWLLTRVS